MALAALRGDKTQVEIAGQYQVHPTRVTEWKKQLPERASDVFDGGAANGKEENVPDVKVRHAKIGQQALEILPCTGGAIGTGNIAAFAKRHHLTTENFCAIKCGHLYCGGPMRMADIIGIAKIAERLAHYARERGNFHGYWSKSALITQTAERGIFSVIGKRRQANWEHTHNEYRSVQSDSAGSLLD